MGKTYPDQLAEWVARTPSSKRDRNLAAFLAVRDDATAGLDAGYPAKTVWRNLRDSGRIAFSYDAFLRYLRRHGTLPAAPVPPPAAPESPSPSTQPPATAKPGQPAAFVFNPVPRKEELL